MTVAENLQAAALLKPARSQDMMEMVFSFRPTRMKLFRVMIAPAILPDILTAWKVNLGNASRVVVVAEIPKGPTGKPQRIGLAEKLGLDAQKLFEIASQSSGQCWSMTQTGR